MRISVIRGDTAESTIDLYSDARPVANGPIDTGEVDLIRSSLAAGEHHGTLADGRQWQVDPAWRDPLH